MANAQYALLKTKHLGTKAPFVQTHQEWEPVLMEDPAIFAMTDFCKRVPFTTSETMNIQMALQQMKLSKVKSLFVVDEQNRILGHISARDIQSPKAAMVARQLGIKPSETVVKMLMIPCSEMITLQFNELSNARIGHIVRLFHELGVNYIFVVDQDAQNQEIMRGLFSISRLSYQLGEDMMSDLSSHSVAEMAHRINQ